jgi:hypothetical protein
MVKAKAATVESGQDSTHSMVAAKPKKKRT